MVEQEEKDIERAKELTRQTQKKAEKVDEENRKKRLNDSPADMLIKAGKI